MPMPRRTTQAPPEKPSEAEPMDDTNLCKQIFRLQAQHVFRILKNAADNPEAVNAAMLDTCRKFLSDNNINLNTLNVPSAADAMKGVMDDLPFK